MNRKIPWMSIVIVGFSAFMFFTIMPGVFKHIATRIRATEQLTATVIKVKSYTSKDSEDDDTMTYTATIVYVVDEKTYTAITDCTESTREGDTIDIWYNPNNPDEFYTEGDAHKAIFSAIMGVFIMAVVALVMIGAKKRKNEDGQAEAPKYSAEDEKYIGIFSRRRL